ncbi:MAG TPA: nuclear transport factor 2 family protein [Methylomirabilota bacterium]|jgi:ketosteroid isomerase-like protein|nr:nuclear transport factor 2 family protein [Methylomirabilota bacterium]
MTPDDDAAEVEDANARFYRAFESLDIVQMDRVWSHGDHVRCIHPGWCLLSGWDAVRQSWEAIFRGSREMRFSISDVDVHVEGSVAWVTCTENILSHARGQIAVTALLATNVFERMSGEWLMTHHHASHTLAAEPPPEA